MPYKLIALQGSSLVAFEEGTWAFSFIYFFHLCERLMEVQHECSLIESDVSTCSIRFVPSLEYPSGLYMLIEKQRAMDLNVHR